RLYPRAVIGQAQDTVDKSSKICHLCVTSRNVCRDSALASSRNRLAQLVLLSCPLNSAHNLREGVFNPLVTLRKGEPAKSSKQLPLPIRISSSTDQLCSIHLLVASSTARTPALSWLSLNSTLPVNTLFSRPDLTLTATNTNVRSKASNTFTPCTPS